MPTDGVLLYALSRELNQKLIQGRVDKIYGLNRTDVLIRLRSAQGNQKLFLSAHPVHGGLYLTKQDYQTPATPSLFTMVLRKHLSGGKLLSVHTHQMDRIVFLDFVARNELGDLCKKTLILEVMGKHSNLILVDDKMVIIDAQKKFNHLVSRHREVLPNIPYVFPPDPDKFNLMDYDFDHLSDDLMKYSETSEQEDFVHLLPQMFKGFSSATVKAILQDCELGEASLQYAGRLEYDRLGGCLADFRELLLMHPREGYLLYRKSLPSDVALLPGKNQEFKTFDSLSVAIDTMYGEKTANDKREQEKQKLKKTMKQRLKKLLKKLAIHEDNIQKAEETDIYRIKGELLTASLHTIRPGLKKITVENYYDPDYAKIEIELNPAISPSANAAKYFKKVSKIREAAKVSREMLYDLKKDIDYLESILLSLDNVTSLNDIEEIEDEVRRIGFIPPQKGKQKKKRKIESKPMRFVSSSGMEILVGKNNRQNDRLTRSANDDDLWLHTKKIPGSHVILKTEQGKYDEQSLAEAATLAAFYSKGRQSSKVEIDYTLKKNVKKPGGAKPGMVIYETNQTFLADPNEELVNNIKRVEE